MNTGKLERFAKTARLILLDGVERKIRYWGFDEKGNSSEQPEAIQGGYIFRGQVYDDPDVPSKWLSLQSAIHSTSFQEIIEKASYVWFNRMVAIKILSKNGYEPAMLDYQDEQVLTPQLLVKARRGQYQYLNDNEKSRLNTVISDYSNELRAFGILLIGYCHNNILLSKVFGLIDDYTELLLPDDILSEKGFLNLLNTSDAITDEDYRQVELIGWLYQFYISDKKAEVFKGFKNNKKAEARDIPAATQIFTPNWIVKYMVQNTVGRIWLDHKPGSPLREKMKYLVESADTENLTIVTSSLITEVTHLKLLDPASGSGHILVEGFDLLYDMYLEEYYSSSEAVESILSNNLFGLDIDLRAAQLARFAILLKAASKYPEILKKGIMPQVFAMPDLCFFTRQEVLDFLGNEGAGFEKYLTSVLVLMQQAQNLGSIMRFERNKEAQEFIGNRLVELQKKLSLSFYEQAVLPRITPFINVFIILSQKYEAVAANPPYMGLKNMNNDLKSYANDKYSLSKSDLFAIFIEQMIDLTCSDSRMSCITMESWMFLSSYEKLRTKLLRNFSIVGLAHFGWHIIGIAFGTAILLLEKNNKTKFGEYSYLTIDDIDRKKNIPFVFPKKDNSRYALISQTNFSKIPGSPIAYWVSEKEKDLYKSGHYFKNYCYPRKGIDTGENERFLRFWYEIEFSKASLNNLNKEKKWFPYNKGGEFRKWYGNREYLINWENDGAEIKSGLSLKKKKPAIRNSQFYFQEGFSWSTVSSSGFSCRYVPEGCLFDNGGCTLFADNDLFYFGSQLNSKVASRYFEFLSPTLNFQPGDVGRMLYYDPISFISSIKELTKTAIQIARKDWDYRENSWDFQQNPLLNYTGKNLEQIYKEWLHESSRIFFQLVSTEEELNHIFIEIYGLQSEITSEVPLKDITILQEELDYNALEKLRLPYYEQLVPVKKDVVFQQMISYAIGCFMGRYRLDNPGLNIAHPNATIAEIAPYKVSSPFHSVEGKEVVFEIDDDAIIPIMGNNGVFTDDALIRIKNFIEMVWGEETISQNLNFLQQALNKDIEDYLVKDFWKYHCRVYSKRPIYWLFASPKGAFQVLVYMHRMNKFTPDKIRTKYLLRHIQYLRNESERLSSQSSTLSREEDRRLEKLLRDLQECEEYDILLKSLGTIEFDLDDGVIKNYALFKGVVAEIK